ncbi:MAG: hypothetical protein LBK65_05705 [Tannerellaceae bacterium]|jgi:hypothetical protein|nr:hypothetical protein [Tannerellaceae bacterium]
MDSFQVIQPSAFLAPYVKYYWFMKVGSAVQASERIIPTGMMCLMFHRGERLFSSAAKQMQPQAFLSGQGTAYTDLSYCGAIDMISVEFRLAGAKAFFKMPMIELNGQNIATCDLSDPELI